MKSKHLHLFAALCFCAALACSCRSEIVDLPRAHRDSSVEAAIDSFIVATQNLKSDAPDAHIDVHSVMLLKHGKVIGSRWLNGADENTPHIMYSVSKTFTTVALGFATADSLLSVGDRVIDFFPELVPDSLSANLEAMRVWDLLTMTCGQSREPAHLRDSLHWVKEFLKYPVEHEPGTFFKYNSAGTYMVSAIVQKVTGEKINDYLTPRLWEPLHIEKPVWEESPEGINCGGWGLWLKTEDMAKLGQLLLQRGEWNGRQILSPEWVEQMTSYKVSTKRPEDQRPDWTAGYCWFMWRCTHNGVRADGQDGQYIIVLPEQDAVIILTSDSSEYQPYMDIVWRWLLPAVE